jgi:cellulose synthase/poly-beta-1,6-N-acetylglucosamine synthase-like glycosyltransferase
LAAVSDALPFVSIIIPTRPGQADIPAVTAALALDYPKDRLEIIVARGQQPAIQRNAAIKAARGEWIYFLDDDSRAQPDNLRRAFIHFQDPNVKMLGGPNLCPPDAPPLEQVFAVVLGSWLAFGPSRARYDSIGAVRSSSEKELILCNMMARRADVLELGGFDESLYPNEENALMDELQKRGAKLIYDPQFIVHRRPRPTLRAFCKMLFTYGRGRAEQFRLHPTPGSALNFVPPLFCVYLVAAPLLALGLGAVVFAPLPLYLLTVLAQTAVSMAAKGFRCSLLAAPLLVASHVFYGLGFWRGLFTKLKRVGDKPVAEVNLETVTL